MRTSYLYLIALVAVFVVIGGIFVFSKQDATTPAIYTATTSPTTVTSASTTPSATTLSSTTTTTTVPTKTTATTTTSGTAAPVYTSADVAKHSSAASCWTSINGNVYDVTSWISKHPGGQQAILSLCGKDGSAAFTNQHEGQPRPEAELATFRIGVLIP